MAEQTRMCFVRDDNAHWYCIPAADRDEFETWAACVIDSPEQRRREAKYNPMAIGRNISCYTFVDPQESAE